MDPSNTLESLQPDRTNRAIIPWTDNELERYLRWMEENSELLQGPTNGWTARLKETVFKDADHIDVKRIKFKFHNMRTSWQRAKQMQEQSGFGLTEAECSSSMNETLNKKCRFFWRLDALFGKLFGWQMPVRQPNNTPVITVDSSTPPIEPRASQQNSSEIAPDITQSSDSGREETSYSSSELDTPIYQSRKRKEPPSTLQREQEDRYENIDRREMLRANQSTWEALEEKRMKIEADIQRELFVMRIQHEKELEERRIQHEKELEERRIQHEKELEERRIQHEKERDERKHRLTESLFSIIMEELRSKK